MTHFARSSVQIITSRKNVFINESEERFEEVDHFERSVSFFRDSKRGGRRTTSKDIRFQRKGGVLSRCLKSGGTKINKRMKGLGRELNRYHTADCAERASERSG